MQPVKPQEYRLRTSRVGVAGNAVMFIMAVLLYTMAVVGIFDKLNNGELSKMLKWQAWYTLILSPAFLAPFWANFPLVLRDWSRARRVR